MNADHDDADPLAVLELLGPSTGGIRVHVDRLTRGLRQRGISAPVVGPSGVMSGLVAQDGVVPVPGAMSPIELIRARRALSDWRERVQLIHAHGLKPAWVATGGRPARPLVVTVHNVVLDGAAGRATALQRRLERFVIGRADRVIAPTAAIAERLTGVVDPDRIRVVAPVSPAPEVRRSRTEIRAGWGIGDDTAVVVSVSRLHPQKDLSTLLRAWTIVIGTHPTARLVIVGEGPLRSELERAAAGLGLTSSVTFAGFSAHAVDEMAAADVMAMSSMWEAIPLVLVEAMQLALPVASTAVGLAPELLSAGVGGTTVPIGEAESLAAAIIELLKDPEAARRIGEAGREMAVTYFDEPTLVDQVISVYRELV